MAASHVRTADDRRVVELRAQLPALARYTYLNTGTAGPLPRAVSDAVAAAAARELEEGRARPGFLEHYQAVYSRARALMAGALGVSVDEVALTGSSGDGLNIVLQGLAWRADDEVVTTAAEHDSALLPLAVLRQRHGVIVRFATVGADENDTVAALAQHFSPRTRLLVFSHVSYATGAVLPLHRLTALAHEHGVPVLADGAQAFGAMPLDLAAAGVDFYVMSGQKWLCGPEGTGALYVRRDALALPAQTFIGYESAAACDDQGYHRPHPGARRFEIGTRYLPSIVGQSAALDWWQNVVGPEWAYARIQVLARRLLAGLSGIAGVDVITPAAAHAGLVSFQVRGVPAEDVVQRLTDDYGILCRSIPWRPWVRFSTGWYNTAEEIDRAVAAVAVIAADGAPAP